VFVQTTTSKRKGGKTYVSYLVRESFRTPQGPRSRTVCNITDLPLHTRDLISASLKGQSFVATQSVQLHEALDYGGLAVLNHTWQRFEMDRLLAAMGCTRQQKLLKAMIYARLLFPCAKLSLKVQAQGTWLPAACGLEPAESFDEDDLYEAMDQMNGHWVRLEQDLYGQAFPNGLRLTLYDLTSTYFEGKGPRGLADYGHSRDHRLDRPQILLAVATDAQGVPVHVSILRGNRADNKTLQGLLRTLRRRFGISEATFVFDGGMSSQINLEAMSQAHLKYVTRLSSATLQSMLAELPEDVQLQLGDRQQVVELTHQGRRYVIAGGRWRQQRDEQRRAARLEKAQKELKRLAAVRRQKVNPQKLASQVGRTLQRLKAHKYFTYEVQADGQLKWSRKEKLIEQEQQIDGWFLLHTNQSVAECNGQQTLEHYKGLLQVEEAFCQVKSYLEVRPVFHWRPDRVINHVRLCFLAYWMSARLGKEWRGKGETEEVPRLLRKLQTIRVGTLQLGEKVCEKLMTEVPQDLNAQLTKLGLAALFAAPP
jgi:Transposase DDE domain